MKKIILFINNYRHKQSNLKFLNEISIICSILLISFIFLITIENIFFLSSINRKFYFIYYLTFSLILILYPIIKWLISYYALFGNNTDEKNALELGSKFENIKDKLLNVIQLNRLNIKSDLITLAIKKLSNDISKISNENFNYKYPKKSILLFLFVLFITIFILINFNLRKPLHRLINYSSYFEPQLPFYLSSINGDINTLSGDTIEVEFQSKGNSPDSINLHWIYLNKHHYKTIGNKLNNYKYTFNNVKSNIMYWSKVPAKTWISSWDTIGTIPNKITVKDRPIIKYAQFKIIPPKYTKMNPYIHNETNINQLEILTGSQVLFDFEANKNLSSAWLLLGDNRINLNINENKINGNILFKKNTLFTVYCLDENLIPNLNPTQYTLLKIEDSPPLILINLPRDEFELDESYEIYSNFNVSDDFEILDIFVEYQIISPEFLLDKPQNNIWELSSNFNKGAKDVNIIKTFDISSLDISMGDEIHFWFNAKDYYSLTKSKVMIGRFPSLEELFFEIEEYETETEEWIEEIQESIEEIFDATEEAKLELLKSEDLSIEKEKSLEESISKVDELFEEIEKIQENINKIKDSAEKNNLFDKDLIEKFDYFQELLSEMLTPELLEAMQKLHKAMENINQSDLMQALENFELNIDQFEEQLNRFIDMFELAQAEQKLDELTETLENLINKQEDLINKIKSEPEKLNMLSARSKKQEQRFSDFNTLLSESTNIIEPISRNISDQINQLSEDSLITNTEKHLEQTTKELSNKNINNSQNNAEDAIDNLSSISEILNQLKDEFKLETIQEMTENFIFLIDNLLTISNQQEIIIEESKKIKSNSPRLKEINFNQNNINRELNQLMISIVELSNQTFFMSPNISRSFGRIRSSIINAILNFEQKKINTGKRNQIDALNNINLTIYLLLDALSEMKNSDSASGFEQFLASMEMMSKQQRGINQGTLQLGQFGLMQQQTLMEQLQAQQEKLKQQLDDLLNDFPGQNSSSGQKISEDMDEVIQDFKNKNITQKTIERQEQIFSRMLDNQKSLAKKDFSNKRESQTGEEFEYSGTQFLPDDLGQKNLLLMDAMESAMEEGHSNEYKKLIRNYFMNLQKEE